MATPISVGRGQITELTHIVPIKRGLTAPPANGGAPVRYADRLRTILEAFQNREDLRFPNVIRLFRGIHVSQWALIDGDTRLLLNVVFDGDFSGYLRALARDIPGMVHLIWSNCEGWQPVRDNSQRLIDFIEAHQAKVNFFYAQNPDLTVPDVEQLTYLRDTVAELLAGKQPADVATWRSQLEQTLYERSRPLSGRARLERALQAWTADQPDGLVALERSRKAFRGLIGALYTQAELIEAEQESYGGAPTPVRKAPEVKADSDVLQQVQGNVLTPFQDADAARMSFLHFEDAVLAQCWLKKLASHCSFGTAYAPEGPYVNVAFTSAGLSALGVDAADTSAFPQAFREGMQQRASLLGDTAWPPAVNERPVHAVVLTHVHADAELRAQLTAAGAEARELAINGGKAPGQTPGDQYRTAERLAERLALTLDTACVGLGLVADAAAGVVLLRHQDMHRPLVETAESTYPIEYFGFRDGLSQPRILDKTQQKLSEAEDAVALSAVCTTGSWLLEHGSFLVARKLRQDAAAFWQSVHQQAQATLTPGPIALAESMMGRRLDGRRLSSTHTQYDETLDEHAFEVGADDGQCPFHSHVRRTHPRLEPAHPRLMRRGMSYVDAPVKGGDLTRGHMFLAFNGDIETQFEFITRNWVQRGNHAGLGTGDRDIISGQREERPLASGRFYSAKAARSFVFDPAFVAFEWGYYLFLPSRAALMQLCGSL